MENKGTFFNITKEESRKKYHEHIHIKMLNVKMKWSVFQEAYFLKTNCLMTSSVLPEYKISPSNISDC